MSSPRAASLRLLGFFLPVLGGGNHFLFLAPEPGLSLLATIVAGVALVDARAGGDARRGGVPLAALAILALVCVLQYALRESGPGAAMTMRAILVATLVHLVFAARPATSGDLRSLVIGLALGTLVTAAYAQYQHWEAFPRIAPLVRASGHTPITAVNANFYAANAYAPFLAAVVLLIAPLAAPGERATTRALAALTLAILLLTLALTESRATWTMLALVFGLLLPLPHLSPLGRDRAAGAREGDPPATSFFTPRWLLAGIFVLVAFASAVALAGLDDLLRVGLAGRLRIWVAALRMIADHWWTGVGLGTFGEAFPRYQLDVYFTRYPHNLVLEVFAEMGVVAAAALVTFLVGGLRRSWLALALARGRGEKGARLSQRALVAASLLLVLHAMVDIDWHAPANPILLALLLTIAIDPPADLEGGRA